MTTFEWMMIAFCVFGFLLIIFENKLRIDKASLALMTGLGLWALYFGLGPDSLDIKYDQLEIQLADMSQILFYLTGAMLVVEVIDGHKSFNLILKQVRITQPVYTYFALMLTAFFLSSVLDNLTTLIVVVTLLKKIVPERNERLLLSCATVFAVNAGGAWTPIGDVTTTMLWIEDRISSFAVMKALFLPSIASLGVFSAYLFYAHDLRKLKLSNNNITTSEPEPVGSHRVLALGILALMLPPILKYYLNLPPFMGIMLGVALLWAITDIIHSDAPQRQHLKVFYSLSRIDFSCVLFFMGVLLAIDALDSVGIFMQLSSNLETLIPSHAILVYLIGIVSAIIDNVPLVSAVIKLFDLQTHPTDSLIWPLTAYCAGVGGSLLIIGSAPGVALMATEKVDFHWYMKKMTLPVFISYTIGYLLTIAMA